MPEKQVPEEDVTGFLRRNLTGHAAFKRLRGKLGDGLGILGAVLEDAKSPTDFLRLWDQASADARVIGNMLACWRRDGLHAAADELTAVLEDDARLFLGEVIPVDQTELMTVVMFDFPRTLEMIRWIRCAHRSSLDRYLAELGGQSEFYTRKARESVWENDIHRSLTHQLYGAFPELRAFTLARQLASPFQGSELCRVYKERVLRELGFEMLAGFGRPLKLRWRTYDDHLEIHDLIFGYICPGDQAAVLSRFSRAQQQHIATWAVHPPKVLVDDDLFEVCFHPETVHTIWRKEHPQASSVGCSNGYGAVILAFNSEHTTRHYPEATMWLSIQDAQTLIPFELTP